MNLSVLIPVGGELETDEWRRRSFDWVRRRYEALLPQAELVYGFSKQQDPYNRSSALNDAFEQSTGDMLLIADADTSFNVAQVAKAITLINECGAPWVIPYSGHTNAVDPVSREIGRYYNLSQAATDYLLGAPPDAEIDEPTNPELWEFKLTSWSGLVVLPRTAWETVGGFPERGCDGGWSWEDVCFRYALDVLVGPHVRVTGSAGWVGHLWHPVADRFDGAHVPRHRAVAEEYRQASTPETMREVIARYGPQR